MGLENTILKEFDALERVAGRLRIWAQAQEHDEAMRLVEQLGRVQVSLMGRLETLLMKAEFPAKLRTVTLRNPVWEGDEKALKDAVAAVKKFSPEAEDSLLPDIQRGLEACAAPLTAFIKRPQASLGALKEQQEMVLRWAIPHAWEDA